MLLSFHVFAHSGRTDGNGGHTDSDTGEYHYHHGYPAHDHYDIDDDGDLDCPYDFDDKTSNGITHSNGHSAAHTNNSQATEKFDWTEIFIYGLAFFALIGIICFILSHVAMIFSDNLGSIILTIGFCSFALAIVCIPLHVILLLILPILK